MSARSATFAPVRGELPRSTYANAAVHTLELETSGDAKWFAVTVRPHNERVAARLLVTKHFESFLPSYQVKRRWSDRMKELETPLFPGYVFSRFCYVERAHVLSIPNVRSIVTLGRNPAPIPDAEIESIRIMLLSKLPVQPWPYLRVGERVRNQRGPLCGVEGILVRVKNAWNVVVAVDALQRSVAVEIGADSIAPARL